MTRLIRCPLFAVRRVGNRSFDRRLVYGIQPNTNMPDWCLENGLTKNDVAFFFFAERNLFHGDLFQFVSASRKIFVLHESPLMWKERPFIRRSQLCRRALFLSTIKGCYNRFASVMDKVCFQRMFGHIGSA